jgi:hypothetical protein
LRYSIELINNFVSAVEELRQEKEKELASVVVPETRRVIHNNYN